MSLDRYVGRAVTGSYLASLVFFVFLTILIDLLNNLGHYLDSFEEKGVGTLELFWLLADFYFKRLPVQFVMIAPFATVIGCMFAIARLMSQNELQPMLFVGRSMTRVLRPTLLCGCFSALAMGACWQWVVPVIAGDVTATESLLSGGDRRIENVVFELRGDTFIGLRVDSYDPDLQRMTGVTMIRKGVTPGDAATILATTASWDAARSDWRLEGGRRIMGKETTDGWEYLGVPDWTPQEILQRGRESIDCDLLSYGELVETRGLRPNRKDVAMALHRHITYPLANLILLMLALPFAIHFERGSRIERVLGAIGVCVAYLLVDLTCQNLGFNGWLHPIVAAWSPTILFGSLGAVMFSGVRT